MSQTPLSGNIKTDALLTTLSWGEQNGQSINLTYSFPNESSTWVENYGNDEPFPPNEIYFLAPEAQQSVRSALQLWANVSNINFIEVQEPQSEGDMRFTFSSTLDKEQSVIAYSPSPNETFFESSGDVWLNSELESLEQGGKEFSALIHQIGYALGLKDPDDSIDFNEITLDSKDDTTQYSILSTNAYGEFESFDDNLPVENTSPMLYDILATQFLYGVNTTYNTGNDTYVFTPQAELKTIWDTGGIDTFDLSNQTLDLIINLNAGQFSSIGNLGEITNFNSGSSDTNERLNPADDNIGIAYGVEIENAIGGIGDDILIGNQLGNQLTGGAGNDVIDGGDGVDTAYYLDNKQDYTIETKNTALLIETDNALNSTLTIQSNNALEEFDTLKNIERLQFNDITLALDIEGNAGQAYRLYQAAFDRTPDKAGLGYWINSLDNQIDLQQAATGFLNSSEFIGLYGENISDTSFVSALYQNVLHRDLDDSGANFWMNELQTGSRENVLIGFSESEENQLQVMGAIQNGIELFVKI